jgi:hypothetical protein
VFVTAGAASNVVGGIAAGAGNVIAFNGDDGVLIGGNTGDSGANLAGVGNGVLGNSIFGNGKIGIDLGPDDGVTANGFNNNVGPNNYQNQPVLTSAAVAGNTLLVTGTLHGPASTLFRVELFASPSASASGHGEGKTFLGYTTALTNSNGDATFAALLLDPGAGGQVISATATDASNNTSEFSADLTAH